MRIHGSLNYNPPQPLILFDCLQLGKSALASTAKNNLESVGLQDLLDMGHRHSMEGLVAEQAIGCSRTGCLDIRVSEQLSHTLVYHGCAASQASLNNQVER